MPDGSYPLTGCTGKDSVKSAALLAHHSKTYGFDQIKTHVMAGMKKFNCPDSVLPESWGEAPQQKSAPPPRDDLYRAIWPGGVEVREVGGAEMPTLTGHFAVFNQWTEIRSQWEGNFMERIAPGAFARTFNNSRAALRVLFQHGKDPQLGDKPLGQIKELREDEIGAYYEVPLFRGIPDLIMDGLRSGAYGASFRFRVLKEELDAKPEVSAFNPQGIPQRTVQEAQVMEFGPVTFPAYVGATAGVRSLTDEFHFAQLLRNPERLRQLLEFLPAPAVALPDAGPEAQPHSDEGTRTDPPQRGVSPGDSEDFDLKPVGLPVFRNPNKRRH